MERLTMQVDEVKQCMTLRGVSADNGGERTALAELHGSLAKVEGLLQEFESFVSSEHAGVVAGRKLLEQLGLREALITHMEANFPQKINDLKQGSKENEPPAHATLPAASKTKRETSRQPRLAVPVMPYVRVTEFEDVPAYMKGRLTRDQLNRAIDVLNKTAAEKYKILATPRAKLGDMAMNLYIQFKELELDELAGKCFIVDSDIKQLGDGRVDRNIMIILRHLHRLSEHRSKGCVRHVLLPC